MSIGLTRSAGKNDRYSAGVNDRSTVHLIHPGNPFSPDPDGIVSVQRLRL